MTNPIQAIIDFNETAGLLKTYYNDALEPAFQIEEALEGFNLEILSKLLAPKAHTMSPKDISRAIVNIAVRNTPHALSDVDRFDKHLDGLVYHIGSLAKLALTSEQILQGLDAIITANQAKIGCPKDKAGKLKKPANFNELYAPEPKLQQILDQRQLD